MATSQPLSMFSRNNIQHKFVSLEPVCGNRLDTYSQSVQDMINAAISSGQNSVYLGDKCFNATIHFKENGNMCQTTPGIMGNGSRYTRYLKQPGYRDVIKMPVNENHLSVYRNNNNEWRYYNQDIELSLRTQTQNARCVDNSSTTPSWQWCQYSRDDSNDAKWYNYGEEHNAQIEEAFNINGRTEVTIIVGIIPYTIKFDSIHKAFAIQENTAHNKSRLVRRAFLNQEEILNGTEGVCAICFDDFSASTIPTSSPFNCTHNFHCACIQLVLDTHNSCPICRAEIE
jgi:hypothetical protein